MFELTYKNAKEFKQIIDVVAGQIEEGLIEVTSEGLHLRTLDPSRVVYIDLEIPPTAFEVFHVKNTTEVGLSFSRFKKILARAKKDDSLTLIDNGDSFLEIRLKGKVSRTFKMPQYDIEKLNLEIPELPHTVKAIILSDTLKQVISDACMVTDVLKIVGKDDKLRLEGYGHVETVAEFTLETEGLLDYYCEIESISGIGLQYFKDIAGRLPKNTEISFEFGQEMPIAVYWELPSGGKLYFLIAPRIEEDWGLN